MFQLIKEIVKAVTKHFFWGGINLLHSKEDSIEGINLEDGSLLDWNYFKLISKIHSFNI